MKKKGLLLGLISLTTISLAGVGFATWVVGVTKREDKGNLNVEVDEVKNDSVYLTAKFDDNAKVAIAETNAVTKPEGYGLVSVSDNSTNNQGLALNENALKFSFSELKYVVGNAISVDAMPKYLKLELKDEDNKFNVVSSKNIKLTDKKGSRPVKKYGEEKDPTLNYLYFKEYVDLTKEGVVTSDTTSNSSTTYTLANKEFKLLWGNFFGNTTFTSGTTNNEPSTYYNNLYKDVENPSYDTLLDASTKAYQELEAMKTVLTAKDTKFTITVSLLTSSEYTNETK